MTKKFILFIVTWPGFISLFILNEVTETSISSHFIQIYSSPGRSIHQHGHTLLHLCPPTSDSDALKLLQGVLYGP